MDRKLSILRLLLGSCRSVGDETLFYCPKCDHHHRKLSVNLNKNKFKCWVCGFSGNNVFFIFRLFKSNDLKQEWLAIDDIVEPAAFDELFAKEEAKLRVVSLPSSYRYLGSNTLPKSSFLVKNYLKSRRLSKADVIRWRIGYCSAGDFAERIIFPSFDARGKLNFFVSRAYTRNQWPPYKNIGHRADEIIFNELNIDWSKEVFLTEGIFDAITIGQNAIPILGPSLDENSALFQKIVKEKPPIVWVCSDPDEVGIRARNRITKQCFEYGITVGTIVDQTYYNKRSDISEMGKEAFWLLERKIIEDPWDLLQQQGGMNEICSYK